MRGLIACLVCLLTSSASAQNPFATDVTYSNVDLATVRVFAVREVGVEQVMGHRVLRTVAIPVAGHGSGVVVDPRGVIVTAAHVVEGARHIAVRLSSGTLHLARVVRQDDALDYAVLVLAADGELPHLSLPEEPPVVSVRSTVDAIGYPLDADRNQPQSSRGIISAAMDDGRLQLSISLNPGNSGGPLIDENENLLGIVVARGNVDAGVQGIGVAVPVRHIMRAHQAALSDGSVARAYDALQAISDRADRASVVDALVRLGGIELLEETANAVDTGMQPERLALFHRLAQSTTDADLLAMLAGYFWDAALVALERSGGYESPAQMPAGAPRDTAHVNWNRAITFGRKATEADDGIALRSPFIRYLATQFPDITSTGTTDLPARAPIEDSPEVRRRRARPGLLRLNFGPLLGAGGKVKLRVDGDTSGSWDLKPSIGGSASLQLSLGSWIFVGASVSGARVEFDEIAGRRRVFTLDLIAGIRRGIDAGSVAIEPFGALLVGSAFVEQDGDHAPGIDFGVEAGVTIWGSESAGFFLKVGWQMQLIYFDQPDATNVYNQVRIQVGLAVRIGG